MRQLYLRINGRGNAWPVPLGQEHSFYSRKDYEDLANASFSLIKNEGDEIIKSNIDWEILIDAGHGVVQYLLNNQNRIPEAIVLTHPHMDHTLGVDWVAQSYYRFNEKKKYPLYATRRCWEFVVQSFPHLEAIIQYKELKPGVTIQIEEAEQLFLTPYPVFHGLSAFGSSMLVFEEGIGTDSKKVIVTGDILFPLLTKKGIEHATNALLLITDSNNRFPYPGTNHWSVTIGHKGLNQSLYFDEWLEKFRFKDILQPHISKNSDKICLEYFDEFFRENKFIKDLPLNVLDFVDRIKSEQTALVHYSGLEDKKYYEQDVLKDIELKKWVNSEATKKNVSSRFLVPEVGDVFLI